MCGGITKFRSCEGFTAVVFFFVSSLSVRFRSMAPMYYRGADAAILVYDVTDSSSLRKVQGWVEGSYLHANLLYVSSPGSLSLRPSRLRASLPFPLTSAAVPTVQSQNSGRMRVMTWSFVWRETNVICFQKTSPPKHQTPLSSSNSKIRPVNNSKSLCPDPQEAAQRDSQSHRKSPENTQRVLERRNSGPLQRRGLKSMSSSLTSLSSYYRS